MRQKNTHGYPLMVPSLGRTVAEGEIIDCDALLAGFEAVESDSDAADGEREPDAEAPRSPLPQTTAPDPQPIFTATNDTKAQEVSE